MITSKVTYLGKLRTQATHLRSNTTIISDAPIDNNGKGEAFSPTDCVATSLATCMLTIMGIKAQSMVLDITQTTAEVTKIMTDNPRRIAEIKITFFIPVITDNKTKTILEKVALNCPVVHSLHPEISKKITFNWQK